MQHKKQLKLKSPFGIQPTKPENLLATRLPANRRNRETRKTKTHSGSTQKSKNGKPGNIPETGKHLVNRKPKTLRMEQMLRTEKAKTENPLPQTGNR